VDTFQNSLQKTMKSPLKWLVTNHSIDRWIERVDEVNYEEAREQLLKTIKVAILLDRSTNGHIILQHIDIRKGIKIFFVVSVEIDNAFKIITVFTKDQFKNPRNYSPDLDTTRLKTSKKEKSPAKIENVPTQINIPETENINTPKEEKSPKPPGGWAYKSFVFSVLDILVTTRNVEQLYMIALTVFPDRMETLINAKRLMKKIGNDHFKTILCENLDPDILT